MNTELVIAMSRWRGLLWRIGAAGVGVAVLLGLFLPGAFFHGYLAAFVLWSGVPLGCGAIVLLHHLVGGRWGWNIRPALVSAAVTVPLFALLFVPVLLGRSHLYPWIEPHGHSAELIAKKAAYLNWPFFLTRAAVVFGLWLTGAFLLRRWTGNAEEADGRGSFAPRFGAIGLMLYVLTVSFAFIDWVGTLEPEWYSSIFGIYVLIGQTLLGLALIVLVICVAEVKWGLRLVSGDVLHDLGNLLLVMVVLHAYFAYSQFFIIWNGNLPHEISWYVPRTQGLWGTVAVALILVHFLLPMVMLMSRDVKRNTRPLLATVVLIVAARMVESAWVVLPSFDGSIWGVVTIGPAVIVGVGGLFLYVWLGVWQRRPALFAAGHTEEGHS